ncbi:hypothetical protein [Caenispirillum bisanense]|uniref:Uncharacterized protein n=1 Tax=Caenispirillum bisanense TaxID=414052 RepID=A0A286GYY6_9PROT|nr:hypothetical protein [Caenispirillum bisanense]SOE00682.1 hypothetical protein SAMN05421508_11397 [Caenispirillum bisanense]
MKFILTEDRRATIDVSAKLPNDKGGMSEFKMKVTYRVLADDEFQELAGNKASDSVVERLAALQRNVDADVLKATVVDWTAPDLVDEAGEPVPFSADALAKICAHVVPLRTAMAAGYVRVHNGEGVRKN